jgi:hypothetical protein
MGVSGLLTEVENLFTISGGSNAAGWVCGLKGGTGFGVGGALG